MTEGPAPESPPDVSTPGFSKRLVRGGAAGALLSWTFVGWVLLLLALTVAGGRLRSPPVWLAGGVTFLPYLYGVTALVGFVGWSLFPDRRAMPLAWAGLLVVGLIRWAPGMTAQPQEAPGQPLKILSWNVRRLWGGPADGGDAGGCVRGVIAAENPDVVTLLEVSRADIDLLARQLGMHCVHSNYFGGSLVTVGGLATCARGPTWTIGAGKPQKFQDDDDRYFVLSEIRAERGRFNVLAVHLDPYFRTSSRLKNSMHGLLHGRPDELLDLADDAEAVARAQGRQSKAIVDRVDAFEDPTLLTGDFNSTRDSALHGRLRQGLVDTWEQAGQGFGSTTDWLSWIPLRVDYIYATPAFAVVDSRVLDAGCSDHRPVVADLVLRVPPGRPEPR